MRRVMILGFVAAMIAGAAAAQGTFNPGGARTGVLAPPGYRPPPPATFGSRPTYGVPAAAAPANRPAAPRPWAPTSTVEEAPGFKPYEPPKPFTGQSTYRLPRPAKPRF